MGVGRVLSVVAASLPSTQCVLHFAVAAVAEAEGVMDGGEEEEVMATNAMT